MMTDHILDSKKPSLYLHDTMQRKNTLFEPIDPHHIKIYFCGPTVYDYAHIGNLRAMLTADILVRTLNILYPRVTFVRNITDIDDKIIVSARENHEEIDQLTARNIVAFHEDLHALNMTPPDIEPRATHNISTMIEMIQTLIEDGNAYDVDGTVFFSVQSFPSYGRLSGKDKDALEAGARVEISDLKKNPCDFVLWKPSTKDQPGWDSPWGRGRPGWHIECSAMSGKYLGKDFDIHGGGEDLLFPHHENERAQSMCCFRGSHFAHYWIHNAMLLVNGEKMSKSKGNFLTIRQALKDVSAEVLRLSLLSTHYRSPFDYTQNVLRSSKATLDRFYRAISQHNCTTTTISMDVLDGLCHDLNVPKALSVMHGLADQALKGDKDAAAQLKGSGQLLGLLQNSPKTWFQGNEQENSNDEAEIQTLIDKRSEAKKHKDFKTADHIRDTLKERGIMLEDTAKGTLWRRH